MNVTLDQIVKHPTVSRAMASRQNWHSETPRAIRLLVRFREALRDRKRAHRNAVEEMEALGYTSNAYDEGRIVALPSLPGTRLLLAALGSEGMDSELRGLIVGYLKHEPSAAEIARAIEATVRSEQRTRKLVIQ